MLSSGENSNGQDDYKKANKEAKELSIRVEDLEKQKEGVLKHMRELQDYDEQTFAQAKNLASHQLQGLIDQKNEEMEKYSKVNR